MFEPRNQPPDTTENSLTIVFQGEQLVSDLRSPEPCLLPVEVVTGGNWQVVRQQFLGYWQGRPCYAVEIDERSELDPMQFQRGSLYQVLGRMEVPLFALAGRAQQVLAWERDHQYCGRCGAQMQVDMGERAMRCAPCGTVNYPRIAPCIITLVTRGESMLLARNANFPRPMFSTLAGFIEAGESAEETLVREVKEEVGVEVDDITYFGSQSWPFPNQLMLGYFARYAGGDIVCDPTEIAEAHWYHFSDLPPIPPASSISGQLIRTFVESHRNP